MEEVQALESLVAVAPLLNKFYLEEVAVYVADTEKVIATYPSPKLDLGVKKGDVVDPDWGLAKAMNKGRRVVIEQDDSVLGISYISIGNPIYNNQGEIIGGISINQSTKKKDGLLEISNELLGTTEVVDQQVEEINLDVEDIINMGTKLSDISQQTEDRVKNTDDIINIIKNIAKKTKMIGINAGIEAARVGQAGQGFVVVAEEIQDLATKTAQSTSEIEVTLEGLEKITASLDDVSKRINEISKEQSEVVSKIDAEIENLSELGNVVIEMSKSLAEDEYQYE
ncbi:methyl-accepting chemotaxis protein [Natroniella sulfidigena]|uniref:methyl-accepting chemotaxis protein n=1 Tax=Natroniella sulfidigena TaxID=723921 RepID=UPI00200AA313|nr:methyl-accepting chemotaxis protein [Natroniella sulfidigena]MCK8817660.1 methyl-accepting chemotaxis protein [Natroniella sulfidigena]